MIFIKLLPHTIFYQTRGEEVNGWYAELLIKSNGLSSLAHQELFAAIISNELSSLAHQEFSIPPIISNGMGSHP